MPTTAREIADLERHFIVALSVHGTSFGGDLTALEKRERIRVAIMAQKVFDLPFNHTGMTYREAFKKAYGYDPELRTARGHKPKEIEPAKPLDVPDADETDDE